jgi:predicted nucleic acid-binding protein
LSTSLVIDANPVLSALLGGAAREIIVSRQFALHSTQHTMFEAAKYIPRLALRLGTSELENYRALQLFPIVAHQPIEYADCLARARSLMEGRDLKDVDILALTLRLGCPIWTDDRDFEGVPGITVRKTAELLSLVRG